MKLIILGLLLAVVAAQNRRANEKLYYQARPDRYYPGGLERPVDEGLFETAGGGHNTRGRNEGALETFGHGDSDESSDSGTDSDDDTWPFSSSSGTGLGSMLRNFFSRTDEDETTTDFGFPDDFGDIFTNFGNNNGFGRRSSPWWKGPNVCQREENGDEVTADTDMDSAVSSITQCYSTDSLHKCTVKINQGGQVRVRTIIRECCYGFEREARRSGCTKRVTMKSLLDTLRELNFTSFVEAIEGVQLDDELTTGNYTVFVPTNDALSTSSDDSENIAAVVLETNDRMQFVRDMVKAHIVPGFLSNGDFEDEETVLTLDDVSTLRINEFTVGEQVYMANCARITSANMKTTNGLIHTVDRLIMPAKQTLLELVNSNDKLTTLRSLMTDDVVAKLSDAKAHYTLLAFTNDAFEALPSELKTRIKNKDPCTQDIVLEHLLPNTICSAAIPQGEALVSNVQGRYLNVTREASVVRVQGATIVGPDRVAKNSLLHIIDKVLVTDDMLKPLEVVGSAFADLVSTQKVKDRIIELNDVTIFVPPEEALMAFYENATNDISGTLLNHIAAGRMQFSPRNPESTITTLNDRQLKLVVGPPTFGFSLRMFAPFRASVDCANVVRANLQTCGGVLHFIDRVLVTPTKNVLETLRGNLNYSQFVMMLEVANLDRTLAGTGFDGTVLVPTNAALEGRMSTREVDRLLANAARLKTFVQNHILPNRVCCNQLGTILRSSQRTLGGALLPTMGVGPVKRVGSARVVVCDILTTNAVLHEIDQPISVTRAASSRRVSIFDLLSNHFGSNLDSEETDDNTDLF